MLPSALVAVALIALCASTILSAGFLTARAAVHRAAQHALSQGYQRAVDALHTALLPYAQNGNYANPLPSFTPLPAVCADTRNPCTFTTSETISLTRNDFAAASATCDSSSIACAANEQTNTFAREGRVIAHIAVAVRAADGSSLAARESDVIVRILNAPPYVVTAGARDTTFDQLSAASAGDDGGLPPATANPCVQLSPGTADDTVVRVAYQNAQTAACADGSGWRSSSY